MHSDIIEILYRKYYKTAYLYTFSLCKSKEITEDIVSQAFEKAYLSLEDERQGFQYWLLLVCKHLWLDYLRKNKKLVEQYVDVLEIPEKAPSPEQTFIKKEQNKVVYESMLLLPSKYREILTLHYYSGIPLTKIAGIMGLSTSNTKTMIHRARVKLKNILEECGYEF